MLEASLVTATMTFVVGLFLCGTGQEAGVPAALQGVILVLVLMAWAFAWRGTAPEFKAKVHCASHLGAILGHPFGWIVDPQTRLRWSGVDALHLNDWQVNVFGLKQWNISYNLTIQKPLALSISFVVCLSIYHLTMRAITNWKKKETEPAY